MICLRPWGGAAPPSRSCASGSAHHQGNSRKEEFAKRRSAGPHDFGGMLPPHPRMLSRDAPWPRKEGEVLERVAGDAERAVRFGSGFGRWMSPARVVSDGGPLRRVERARSPRFDQRRFFFLPAAVFGPTRGRDLAQPGLDGERLMPSSSEARQNECARISWPLPGTGRLTAPLHTLKILPGGRRHFAPS